MFNDTKYTKCYFRIIDWFRTNQYSGYTENHHIIPKCLGGDNSKINKIRLSARAHFVCHKLLIRMVNGQAKYKMLEAVAIFSNNKKRKLKLNSRDISLIREANAIASKDRNKGNKHYLHRAPASTDLRLLRSTNASSSKWVNNGSEERFVGDHDHYVTAHGYQYGRLPFSKTWIDNIAKNVSHLHTPEVANKISKSLIGKPKTESHRARLSEAKKNEPPITCEHCGKITNSLNYNRWHGTNCKTIKNV